MEGLPFGLPFRPCYRLRRLAGDKWQFLSRGTTNCLSVSICEHLGGEYGESWEMSSHKALIYNVIDGHGYSRKGMEVAKDIAWVIEEV